MHNLKWSESEKKLARRLFETALRAELNEAIAEFKSKAASVTTPEAMWELGDYLAQRRRDIDAKYDYRYSQLLVVFGRLVRERRLPYEQLHGLSAEKRTFIQRLLEL